MAELVDASDLKSDIPKGCVGSSPTPATKQFFNKVGSSSGLGHMVFIHAITGSNPVPTTKNFLPSSNGRTAGFGPVSRGSNP